MSATRSASRLPLLLATLCLLTMPSSYRGGAELPHPHAFFQFWGVHHHDPFDHHHHGDHGGHGDHDHRLPSRGEAAAAAGHAAEQVHARPSTSDAPALLDAASPFERASKLGLLAPLLGAWLWPHWCGPPHAASARALVGLSLTPDHPPPRLSMTSA